MKQHRDLEEALRGIKNFESLNPPYSDECLVITNKFIAKLDKEETLLKLTFKNTSSIDNIKQKLNLIGAKYKDFNEHLIGVYYTTKIDMNNTAIEGPWIELVSDLDMVLDNYSLYGSYEGPFKRCYISEIDVSNTIAVDLKRLFENCYSTNIILGNIKVKNTASTYKMFKNCRHIQKLDFGELDLSKTESMREMFDQCNSIQEVNLSQFNISNLKTMEDAFRYCNELERILMPNINLGNCDIENLFLNCQKLKYIDLSSTMSHKFSIEDSSLHSLVECKIKFKDKIIEVY